MTLSPDKGAVERCNPCVTDPKDDRAPWATMLPSSFGGWVRFADYEALRSVLTAESDALRRASKALERAQSSLTASEKDAERYRWLRNTATTGDWQELGGLTAERAEEEIDKAVAHELEKDNG